MIEDPRKQCMELRLRLYENGYTPLPNKNKMCLLPGWNTLEITPELIQSREWNRSAQRRDTGLRCGDIIAIDWDINDAALLTAVIDGIVAAGIIPRSDFVRVGKAPREMWIFRTHEKIGKRTTGFFAPKDAEEGFKPHQVEILGRGCQIAAYGMRDPETWYTWPKLDLLDHKYMDLPEITMAQVEAIKTKAVEIFEAEGLVRKSSEAGAEDGYTTLRDLTPEMTFDVKDMGVLPLSEIEAYLRKAPPETVLRCRVETLRPGTSGSWAGMISITEQGDVCVSDHGSYTTHFYEELADDLVANALGKVLLEKFGAAPAAIFQRQEAPPVEPSTDPLAGMEMHPSFGFDDNLEAALKRYAYVLEYDTIADAVTNKPDTSATHFKNAIAQYYQSNAGQRGGVQITTLYDIWMREPRRNNVKTFAMRPDMPYPFFEEDGVKYFNTYRPHDLPVNGDASVGLGLLDALLPIESERDYFKQWMAYKVQHPETRGPGIIMVANDTFGTGRGTLVEIIKDMFAPHLTRIVDFDTLTGKGTQGQYNEWLSDAVLVAVNEAQEVGSTGSKWQNRQNAYEHLKNIVDPGHHDVYIKRKGLGNYQGKTYASILVMTNHMDSVILPKGDRRFAILENGTVSDPAYWEMVHAWRKKPENIGAMRQWFLEYNVGDYKPYAPPPMTHAKHDMVDAGESVLDKAVNHIFANMKGPLLVRDQLLIALEDYIADHSIEPPDEWRKSIDRIFTRRTRSIVDGLVRVMYEGKYRFARLLERREFKVYENEALMLTDILLNGPISRQVQTGGSVVSFPKR